MEFLSSLTSMVNTILSLNLTCYFSFGLKLYFLIPQSGYLVSVSYWPALDSDPFFSIKTLGPGLCVRFYPSTKKILKVGRVYYSALRMKRELK